VKATVCLFDTKFRDAWTSHCVDLVLLENTTFFSNGHRRRSPETMAGGKCPFQKRLSSDVGREAQSSDVGREKREASENVNY
jgi:hypothetical protein